MDRWRTKACLAIILDSSIQWNKITSERPNRTVRPNLRPILTEPVRPNLRSTLREVRFGQFDKEMDYFCTEKHKCQVEIVHLIINPQICLSHDNVFLRNYQGQANETLHGGFLCLPSGFNNILVPLPTSPSPQQAMGGHYRGVSLYVRMCEFVCPNIV